MPHPVGSCRSKPVSWSEPLLLQEEIKSRIAGSRTDVDARLCPSRGPVKDFRQHVTKRLFRVRQQIVRPPRHEAVRPDEDASAIVNFAPPGPITRHVVVRLPHADRMCSDLQAEFAPHDRGRINPCPASYPREQREARIVSYVERR